MSRVTKPDFLSPFVLPTPASTVERHGSLDLYLPDASEPRPAIVVIHGGPVPAELQPTPREWPVFQGYAATAAARGVVGVTVDHGPHRMPDPFGPAAAILADAVEAVRADDRVDADRIALWSFSGGGLLLADWLRDKPSWVRVIGASYPVFGSLPGWPDLPRFTTYEAVKEAGDVPIVLTRVGLENPAIAETVEKFVAVGPAGLQIIDVPDGHHSFDCLDHTEQSRDAVNRAFDLILGHLTA
jgi:dienelactone hydrolase